MSEMYLIYDRNGRKIGQTASYSKAVSLANLWNGYVSYMGKIRYSAELYNPDAEEYPPEYRSSIKSKLKSKAKRIKSKSKNLKEDISSIYGENTPIRKMYGYSKKAHDRIHGFFVNSMKDLSSIRRKR